MREATQKKIAQFHPHKINAARFNSFFLENDSFNSCKTN